MHPFRLLVFIVSYNAEKHIAGVLDRIPASIWNQEICHSDVLVIDDDSQDATCSVCESYAARTARRLTIQRNAINQGYGGNQKLGYQYAIDHGYDAVVLLHGDGQYDPALIPLLMQPVMNDSADVVIGSRMMNRGEALKGGMPFYKFVANIIISKLQNLMLGTRLSEFHSGYRAYSAKALQAIPFHHNSNYFDFDTDILIQLLDTKQRIVEIAIPTFYGDEICYVNGLKYVALILISTLRSRLQRFAVFHTPKFDYAAKP